MASNCQDYWNYQNYYDQNNPGYYGQSDQFKYYQQDPNYNQNPRWNQSVYNYNLNQAYPEPQDYSFNKGLNDNPYQNEFVNTNFAYPSTFNSPKSDSQDLVSSSSLTSIVQPNDVKPDDDSPNLRRILMKPKKEPTEYFLPISKYSQEKSKLEAERNKMEYFGKKNDFEEPPSPYGQLWIDESNQGVSDVKKNPIENETNIEQTTDPNTIDASNQRLVYPWMKQNVKSNYSKYSNAFLINYF